MIVAAPLLAIIALVLPRVDRPKQVPILRLPVFPKGTRVFGVAMALAWSTTGMTIAVVSLELAVNGLGGWTGLVIFLAIFVGFLCQPIARRLTNSQSLALGFVLIPLGFLVLLAGVWLHLLALVLIGTCITSAASYGFSYLASLSEVSQRPGPWGSSYLGQGGHADARGQHGQQQDRGPRCGGNEKARKGIPAGNILR
jgi:hypothetical protein